MKTQELLCNNHSGDDRPNIGMSTEIQCPICEAKYLIEKMLDGINRGTGLSNDTMVRAAHFVEVYLTWEELNTDK